MINTKTDLKVGDVCINSDNGNKIEIIKIVKKRYATTVHYTYLDRPSLRLVSTAEIWTHWSVLERAEHTKHEDIYERLHKLFHY